MELRMLRLNKGLSQVALAKEVGLAHNTIGRIEAGELPSAATAYKLASFFGKDVTDLFPELTEDRPGRVA